ncbi:MAG: 50S ribosomal protein L1 [Acidimicrobiia bacterium]|nr:50S ribosomal protein L1 [Acidimicrobiia bacterium]
MPKHGKRYRDLVQRYDKETAYSPEEAIEFVRMFADAKFDESIDVAFKLGIDPRQADQIVRGTVSLPHGTGQVVRVVVFAQADKAREAEAAGADLVGGSELAEEIAGGRALDFDIAIATPDMMAEVGKLGRVLGPRGLMPNPKAGTVTVDVARAVQEFKSGRIEYRNDRFGNVQVPIGKASFEAEALVTNLGALAAELQRVRPASAKGRYFRHLAISSTMGPGIKIDPARLEDLVKASK